MKPSTPLIRRAAAALCAAAAPALASDLDALSLQVDAAAAPDSGSQLFVEGSVGWADQRYGLGSRSIGRLAVDARHTHPLGDRSHVVVSARLDASRPEDDRIDNPVFSLREAYVGWQNGSGSNAWEIGRVNLREGPGYGYNPTDFLRDNALRTISTQNPFSLRENRLGSVMLRGQRSWAGGSVSALFSPKLDNALSHVSFSADHGATNARHRGQVALANRWSDAVNTQLTLYKEDGAPLRLGLAGTALVSDAAVAHAEWSYGREPSLLERALGPHGGDGLRHRVVAGLTYTTSHRLSMTVEGQYNGFALDRNGWRDLQAAGLQVLTAYHGTAVALQDNAGRHTVMLYAVRRDLGVRNLDLTALARWNLTDRSRLAWLELRYRWDRFDVAMQWQHGRGDAGTEFGLARIRQSTSLVGTLYF